MYINISACKADNLPFQLYQSANGTLVIHALGLIRVHDVRLHVACTNIQIYTYINVYIPMFHIFTQSYQKLIIIHIIYIYIYIYLYICYIYGHTYIELSFFQSSAVQYFVCNPLLLITMAMRYGTVNYLRVVFKDDSLYTVTKLSKCFCFTFFSMVSFDIFILMLLKSFSIAFKSSDL